MVPKCKLNYNLWIELAIMLLIMGENRLKDMYKKLIFLFLYKINKIL